MENNDNKNTQAEGTPNTANVEVKKGGESTETKKTFTQEEVNEMISNRVNELTEKNKGTVQEAVNTAVAEYERKTKLTQEEKDKEERTKREAEIKAREEEITLRERMIEAKDMLSDKKISTDLAEFVVDLDANKTKTNVETLIKAFNKAVEDGVADKLKGSPPEDYSNNQETQKKGMPSHF